MQEFPRIYESTTCLIVCIMEFVCLILELCALWCLYALVIKSITGYSMVLLRTRNSCHEDAS